MLITEAFNAYFVYNVFAVVLLLNKGSKSAATHSVLMLFKSSDSVVTRKPH